MEALVADGLLCEGILPSVLLMAVDDRILDLQTCGRARTDASNATEC